ncbi:helix-turn-helix transcriptional regulator [uncultured Prevotella sp.]|jgi:transcriptional regulator with XRE-family HTH domain|uniref:helix-turn-helix domain-containing protein n=1 Tax=uncultured Prevotella sp. TaxID=159272 RepID=UPI0027E2B3C0|nr:helix-turn-helix transcriptional regulator [uncultured Prevotella sp.]
MVYIKDVLKKYGITQIELAEKMGINRVSLNVTLNNPNIKLSTLGKLADAIGCDVAEFFTPADKADHNVITCPHCGAKLEINLSISDKKHE